MSLNHYNFNLSNFSLYFAFATVLQDQNFAIPWHSCVLKVDKSNCIPCEIETFERFVPGFGRNCSMPFYVKQYQETKKAGKQIRLI